MKNIFTNFIIPAIISSLLILPFVNLELVNRQGFHEGFPFVLFVLMWFLQTAFIIVLIQIVQSVRKGNRLMANPLDLFLKVSFLALAVWMWSGILMDQMPCFLGLLNCD